MTAPFLNDCFYNLEGWNMDEPLVRKSSGRRDWRRPCRFGGRRAPRCSRPIGEGL